MTAFLTLSVFVCREEREKFIKAKYIDKEFLAELPRYDKPVPDVS